MVKKIYGAILMLITLGQSMVVHSAPSTSQSIQANIYMILSSYEAQAYEDERDAMFIPLVEALALKKNHVFVSSCLWNNFCNFYTKNQKASLDHLSYLGLQKLADINFDTLHIYKTPCGLIYLTPDATPDAHLFKTSHETSSWWGSVTSHWEEIKNNKLSGV